MKKVLVIGFDGADWNLLDSFMKRKLPNFGKLAKEGFSGPLKSTTPPISPPAWASMVTGVNPGKHGVFEFFKFDRECFKKKIEFNPIRVKKIWNYLDETGFSSVIINFPLMYPPEKIKGITVSGLVTPSSTKYFTYPKHLSSQLRRKGYEVEIHEDELFTLLYSDIDALFHRLMENMEYRARISLDLLKKHKWDFSMVVFGESDRIQHFFWNDESSILKCYEKMDEILGDFLSFIDDDTVMMVVSDHGFKGIKKYFYINSLFAKKGFLSLKKKRRRLFERDKLLEVLNNLHLKGILKHVPSGVGKHVPDSKLSPSEIDFAKTRVYSTSGYGHIILKEQDSKLAANLIRDLSKLRDPDTDEKIVDKILRKEDIFSGPYLKDAPDFVVIPTDGYMFHDKFIKDELFEEPERVSGLAKRFGEHADEGILFAFSKGMKKKRKMDSTLYDITPTVLDFFDVHPDNLDGKPIREITEV